MLIYLTQAKDIGKIHFTNKHTLFTRCFDHVFGQLSGGATYMIVAVIKVKHKCARLDTYTNNAEIYIPKKPGNQLIHEVTPLLGTQ